MIVSTARNANENEFLNLLDATKHEMEERTQKDPSFFLTQKGTLLEQHVCEVMNEKASMTPFEGGIEKISGQKFPDIVATYRDNGLFGLEVKTTTQDHWTTTGSSIFEGTRVPGVESIFLFFAKLVDPIEYKIRRYEDCLYDVAVTHSPRYLIDMNATPEQTIFSKIGCTYDELRNSKTPFRPIREYYRETSTNGNKADVWWCSDDDEDTNAIPIQAKLFNSMSCGEKRSYQVKAMALFPEVFGSSSAKYYSFVFWLVTRYGIVYPNARDEFSAGGQRDIVVNGSQFRVPKVFYHLQNNTPAIQRYLTGSEIDYSDVKYFWNLSHEPTREDILQLWIEQVDSASKPCLEQLGFTARDLIEEKLM